jgi:hypothetical protein
LGWVEFEVIIERLNLVLDSSRFTRSVVSIRLVAQLPVGRDVVNLDTTTEFLIVLLEFFELLPYCSPVNDSSITCENARSPWK